MSANHRLLRTARTVHLYYGVFITPALLFFAFTGAIQTFSLHESRPGSDYKPPAILVKLGQLHKKQAFEIPHRRTMPRAGTTEHTGGERSNRAEAPRVPAPAPAHPESQKRTLPMKIFFLIVAIGLALAAITGLYMSYKFIRNKKLVSLTLAAGIVIPALLLWLA